MALLDVAFASNEIKWNDDEYTKYNQKTTSYAKIYILYQSELW